MIVFTEQTIFSDRNFKNYSFFLLNKQFYWTNDSTEQTILLNEQFYTEKKNEMKNLRLFWAQIKSFFFEQLKKKRTKWVVHEWWSNEMKEYVLSSISFGSRLHKQPLHRHMANRYV